MTRTCQVIDASHWNNVTDWSAVKGSGVIGVMLKATDGTSSIDTAFKTYCEGALTAGLKVGAYHYLQPGSDDEIDAQMALFQEVIQPWNITRLALDYEEQGLTLTSLKKALASLSTLNASACLAIYGGSLLKGQLGDGADQTLSQYPLWLAHYSANPTWPHGVWPQWKLWQFNDGSNGPDPKQEIAGIATGVVDHNVFDGDDAACAAWFDPVSEPVTDLQVLVTAGKGVTVVIEADSSLADNEVIVYAGLSKIWVTA